MGKKNKTNDWKKIFIGIIATIALFLFITSSYSMFYNFISANNVIILIFSSITILVLILLGMFSRKKVIKKIFAPLK